MYFFLDIHELLVCLLFPAEVVKIDELASTMAYSLSMHSCSDVFLDIYELSGLMKMLHQQVCAGDSRGITN